MSAEKIKRCAIYIRVSTAMQRMEGWSLDAQRAGLTEYAQKRGWKVVGVYADEGKTARKRLKDRREIFRLMEDVEAGDIDIILFKELDRWFRNVSDFYKVQDVLDKHGVEWVSERQPGMEMRTKEGRLQVNVLLSVGQNEADATSERIKYTNRFMREQRRWTSGPANLPRGYTLDDDQHVVIDREQEPFIRDLIASVLRHQSLRQALIETCNAHGQLLRYNNAVRLLRNPLLYGEYKDVPEFVAKPYLTKAEFDELQGAIQRQARTGARRVYIFSGLLRCSECGAAMAGNTSQGNSYYRCNKVIHNREHAYTAAAELKLEQELLEQVTAAVEGTIAHVESVQQNRRRQRPKNNRAQIEKKLDRLEDLYIESDRMTREKYEERRAAILAQLIEDDGADEDLPNITDLRKIQELLNAGVGAVYEGMSKEEKRLFWRGILNSVTIGPGSRVIDIDFNA